MQTGSQGPSNGLAGGDESMSGRRARIDHAGRSAEQAWVHAREAVTDLRDAIDLEDLTSRHPIGTVAAALGIGYVLGGGLFTRFTARLLGFGVRVGLRLAVLPMIKDEIVGLASAIATPSDGSAEVEPSAQR
jgi:hypothetical protein